MRRFLTLAALLAPVPAFAHGAGDHVHGVVAGRPSLGVQTVSSAMRLANDTK